MWSRYLEALQKYPIRTNTATAFCINFLGDVLAQNIEHHTAPTTVTDNKTAIATSPKSNTMAWDARRTWTVASFGMVSAGPSFYWFRWLDRTFPLKTKNREALWTLAKKLTVHLGLYAPAINASFYGCVILKNRLLQEHDSLRKEGQRWPTFWQEWYTKLERDLLDTQKNSVKIWGTAQSFNFWVLPTHLRVLFSNVVMVGWMTYLSVVGHQKHEEVEWESVPHD